MTICAAPNPTLPAVTSALASLRMMAVYPRTALIPETPKAGNPVFDKCQTVVVGNNALAVAMAEERAQALGYSTLVLSTLVEGEAREVAKMMCGIAKEVRVRRPFFFFFFFFCFFFFSLPLPATRC